MAQPRLNTVRIICAAQALAPEGEYHAGIESGTMGAVIARIR
ncbi:hypothetical protein HCH_03880 [Hahella chejuensis KCTC 2396]|uniref:Uncharacterized protein n=1 Tax=Hahella chejuensis (strain KCTC 2396) TaxID=349521 RepID=Q2SFG7_HAHCH|nr:hypothetical protein HCH_03880 [Hahella chejuensis KCTC 2396]